MPWEELDIGQRALHREAGKPWVSGWGQLGSAPGVPVVLLREGMGSRQQTACAWQLGRTSAGTQSCLFSQQLSLWRGLYSAQCSKSFLPAGPGRVELPGLSGSPVHPPREKMICCSWKMISQQLGAGQRQEPALPWGTSWPGPHWCVSGRLIHCLLVLFYMTHL